MKIGVDARILTVKPKGVSRVFRSILQHISQKDNTFKFFLYSTSDPYNFNLNPNFKYIILDQIKGYRYDTWMHIKLSYHLYKSNFDVCFFPANRVPAFHPKPSVVIVHDTKLLRLSSFLNKLLLLIGIFNATKIVTVSNFSKNDLNKKYKVPLRKIKVIYNGIDEYFKPIEDDRYKNIIKSKYNVDRYLFALGSSNPDKNTTLLLKIMDILKKKKVNNIKLIISGITEDNFIKYLKHQISKLNLENNIILTGFVSNEDLLILYNFADIFLYPQTDEGFGLPPIEAMACGTPVIASNSTSIPEIVGISDFLAEPHNANEFADKLIKLLNFLKVPSEKRKIRIKCIERASLFSWDKACDEYIKLFKSISKK